jgi:methylglutamate dehydrogenase subunit D
MACSEFRFIEREALPVRGTHAVAQGGAITALLCRGLRSATVVARKRATSSLSERIYEHFGAELSCGPHLTAARDLTLAGIGIATWLALHERGGDDFAQSLATKLEGVASVTDQSHAYVALRLGGGKVRDALCKLVPIDLHAGVFKVGDVAATVATHSGIFLWRLSDHVDGTPVFQIAIPRSVAMSFWHAFEESSAEFGLIV